MPSVSSLLRSAQATQKKIKSQEDALIAFEWENSMQTYEDFLEYSKYLQERAATATDPSDNLTYQNKIRSARRSYTSNELQRQQMAIMEGRGTTQDKLNAIQNLYGQAVENGDFNLAQNLYSQWDALTIKAQNEAEAGAKAFAAQGDKAYTDLKRDLTKGFDDVTLPSGEVVTPLAAIAADMEATGGSTATWKAAQDTLEAVRGVIVDQYENATTQEQIDKLEDQYGAGLSNIDKDVTFNIGGKKLSIQDVVNATANEEMNNPVYGLKAVRNESTGETEYKLTENNIERIDYARQFDPATGEEYYTPVNVRTDQNSVMFGSSDQGRGLSTQLTNEGQVVGADGEISAGEGSVERDSSQAIGTRLKELGIVATQNGTSLSIKLPGENIERQAIIQPDGSIRYFGDDGNILEIALTRKNLGTEMLPQIVEAGQTRVVAPDEISDFGADSAFGGRLSQMSNQGQRQIQSITGQTKVNGMLPGQSPIAVGNDFRGYGAPAMGSNLQGTSSLLQSAGMQRQQIQQEQMRQQMLQQQAQMQLQATSNQFNLNQTPVQQLASNGVMRKQLAVAAPTPTPRVVVAAPAPTQTIVGVGTAQNVPRVSGVGNYSRNYNLSVR